MPISLSNFPISYFLHVVLQQIFKIGTISSQKIHHGPFQHKTCIEYAYMQASKAMKLMDIGIFHQIQHIYFGEWMFVIEEHIHSQPP